MGTILQRMILWDLLKIFVITLISLTGLFVLGGLVSEASQRGLAPAQILTIIPLMIPSMLPYTIPAATLFATCNVYGRLAKDNEITALRAAGVSLARILLPSAILGVMSSGATLALYYHTIPRSCQMVREHLLSDVNELMYTALKRNGSISYRDLPYVLFAREVRGDRLIDVIFKKWPVDQSGRRRPLKTGGYDTVARARWATLRVEKGVDKDGKNVNFVVVSMSNIVYNNEASKAQPGRGAAIKQEFREPLPSEVFGDKDVPRACDLPWPELLRKTDEIAERERQFDIKLREAAKREHTMGPQEKDWFIKASFGQKYTMREYRSFEAEIQLRPALALGCLCFVLIGGPIGIWTNRADFLSSFVIGFLPTIALYYPVVMCATKLAKDGRVPMVPAIWTANSLFLLAAGFMCWRLVRR